MALTEQTTTARGAAFDRRPLIALCLGWFVVIVDATIVNVALPDMGRELGASVSGLQWVLDGYTVTLAGLLLTGGFLADRYGARRVFVLGLSTFGVASVGCALAPWLGFLITTRVVQGAGAAMLIPACLTLIQATYDDRAVRARAIGIWATVGGVAGGSGPLLGGALTDAFGWRALFWVNVPLVLVTLGLTRRYVTAGGAPDRARHGFDLAGQITGGVALLALTAGVVEGGRTGWGRPVPLALLAVAVLAAVAFVWVERRAAHPMLPATLFADRGLSVATSVGFVMNFSLYGMLFVEALALERRYGFTPLMTGLALLPQAGITAVGSWCGGRVTSRRGPRLPMATGMAIGAAGFFGLTLFGPSTPYWVLVPGLLASGFGVSFCMPAATSAAVEAAPPGRGGIAAGVLNASRQVGGAVGIALLGAFIATAGSIPSLVGGVRVATVVAGGGYLVGFGLALSYPRGRLRS